MKIVIVLCLLVYFAQGDYFAQLPLNKILTDRANEAINTFLGTLNFYLDCSLDPEPRSTRKNGRQKYNNIGNFATRWRS